MRRIRHTVAVTAAVIGLVIGVSGCSGGDPSSASSNVSEAVGAHESTSASASTDGYAMPTGWPIEYFPTPARYHS